MTRERALYLAGLMEGTRRRMLLHGPCWCERTVSETVESPGRHSTFCVELREACAALWDEGRGDAKATPP